MYRVGIFYGVSTLKQIITLHSTGDALLSIPFLEIDDKPDIENRGCMLDISFGQFVLFNFTAVIKYTQWKQCEH